MMNGEIKKWDDWNKSGGPQYPHCKLIQYMFRSYPPEKRAGVRVLDLGCGSGVNTKFLAFEGFDVYGTDISNIGIENTRNRLVNAGLDAVLSVEPIDAISFGDDFFDCVISIGVLDAAGRDAGLKAFKEVRRVLKPGAKGFFVFASDEDFRPLNKVLDIYGYSRSELDVELQDASFSKFWIDRYITTYENDFYRQNDFVVTVFK